jgi:tRNA (cytosine49-C5)-methyltransferase
MKADIIQSSDKLVVKPKFEERYRELLGDRYEEFMACSITWARKSIRVNTIKKDLESVKKSLSKNWKLEEVPWCKEGFWIEHRGEGDDKRYDIGNTLEHVLGYIYVQDAASMIPPVVLNPQPGETVLDLCAAPGSKTSQIAAMMENSGVLIGNDMAADRLKALGINLQRTGTKNAILTQMNGMRLKNTSIKFDKVLVDAPCSGTGTIRKSFMNMKMWSPGLVKNLVGQQRQLIASGFESLKPGGTMVYSTCTLEPEENEGMVNWLLENYPDARVEEIDLPIKRSPAILEFDGQKYDESVSKTLRIWPQDNDTEGFFISKIRKVDS